MGDSNGGDYIVVTVLKRELLSTGNDRYSGHGYSGIDRYSGKNPDDAILFTVSGITAIVEQKFRNFRFFAAQSFEIPLLYLFYFQKIRCITIFWGQKDTAWLSKTNI